MSEQQPGSNGARPEARLGDDRKRRDPGNALPAADEPFDLTADERTFIDFLVDRAVGSWLSER